MLELICLLYCNDGGTDDLVISNINTIKEDVLQACLDYWYCFDACAEFSSEFSILEDYYIGVRKIMGVEDDR